MQETQETWVQSQGQKNPLEEVMAAHTSILAWEIPWTEEPGGLRSMGSQSRIWLDWVTEHTHTHTHTHTQWTGVIWQTLPYPNALNVRIHVWWSENNRKKKQKLPFKALWRLCWKHPAWHQLIPGSYKMTGFFFFACNVSLGNFTKWITKTSPYGHSWTSLVYYNEESTCLKIVWVINHRRLH